MRVPVKIEIKESTNKRMHQNLIKIFLQRNQTSQQIKSQIKI